MLLAFMAQTFDRFMIEADFYANRNYVAANLCENKDKPWLHCCGKCQLNKKLKEHDNNDEQNTESKGINKDEVISSKSFFPQLTFFTATVLHEYQQFICGPVSNYNGNIFHPPANAIA
jgi:hypothetical protein